MESQHHAHGNMEKMFVAEAKALRSRVGLPENKAWQAEPKEMFDRYVRNVFLQTWGVLDGYNAMTPGDKMSLVDLFFLQRPPSMKGLLRRKQQLASLTPATW